MDALPFIARDVMEEFQFTTAIMSTSRGCTRNCSFCSSPDFWRQRKVCWRGRSPENIADEIELIVEKYNIHNFDFIDASFEDPDKNCSRLLSISNEFIKRQLKIVYTASIRVDSVLVLEKYFNILRESGLRNIFLGIESGNEDDLSLYNKSVTLQSAEKAINLLKKYNFNVEIGFINFNPYSTFEKLRSNIQFLHKYGYTSYLINTKRLRVYKGCGIAEKILRDNLLAPDTGKFIYDYKFKDPRVGELYLAISQFIQFDYRNYNFFTKYQNYSIYFFEYTEGLRETFPNSVDVITDCEEDVRKKLSIFSEINYSWFVKMIDLGENGSSATEMMDYTLKHLYSKEAISTLSAIEEIERKLKKLEGSLRACKP